MDIWYLAFCTQNSDLHINATLCFHMKVMIAIIFITDIVIIYTDDPIS